MSRTKSVLLPLIDQLRKCPAKEGHYSGELLNEQWELLRQKIVKNNKPTLAIITALILESNFSTLLNREESGQLFKLAGLALERYEAKNKTSKVGRTLFDSIKETS